ncbi:hypothetical protein LMIY3S_02607 [Labrys miyagiensis]
MKKMLVFVGFLVVPLAGCATDGYSPYDPYYSEPGYAAPIYYGDSYYYNSGYPRYRGDYWRHGRPWRGYPGQPRPPVTSPGGPVAGGGAYPPRPRPGQIRPVYTNNPNRPAPRIGPAPAYNNGGGYGAARRCPPGTGPGGC